MLSKFLSFVGPLAVILCWQAAEGREVRVGVRPEPQGVPFTYWTEGAATVGESWARGQADVCRAWGEAARSLAEAACYRESARAASLINRRHAVQLFFELRELNHRQRLGKPKSRSVVQNVVRERVLARPRYVANDGSILWPATLCTEPCDEHRAILQYVITGSAKSIGLKVNRANHTQAIDALHTLQAGLLERVKEIPTMDYIEASHALDDISETLRSLRIVEQ